MGDREENAEISNDKPRVVQLGSHKKHVYAVMKTTDTEAKEDVNCTVLTVL